MSKLTLLFIGLITIQCTVLSQQDQIDSFHQKFEKAKTLEEKAEVSLSFINSDFSYQVMDTFFMSRHQRLLREGVEGKNRQVANVARLSLAMNYLAAQRVDESIAFLERIGHQFYEDGDLRNHYHTVQTLAKALMMKGAYAEGFEKVKVLEELKPKLKNWNNTVLSNELKGYALLNLGKQKEAEECYKIYIKDAQRIQKNVIIANAYARLGELYQNSERYDEAEENFIKSAEAALKSGLETQVGSAKTSLAIIEYYRGNYESAESLFKEAFEVQKNSGKNLSICDALFNLGVFYFEKGDLRKAVTPFEEILRIARANKLDEKEMEVMLEFAHLYDQLGDKKKSIEHYERYIELKDKIQAREVGESDSFYSDYASISIFEQKKETERLQEELKNQDERLNTMYYSFLSAILFVCVLVGSLMFYFYRKKLNSISEG